MKRFHHFLCMALLFFVATTNAFGAAEGSEDMEAVVRSVITPLMKEHDIPGMAVGLTMRGQRHFYYFGLASREKGVKVNEDTIFEIGSVSKTFTALLAAWAQEQGSLSLQDALSAHMPELAGSDFDGISLLELGLYTAGGLPLHVPGKVTDKKTLIAYCKEWRPVYAPGTRRLYSNTSIGLLGMATALSQGRPFERLMEDRLFPALGLTRTWIIVPGDRMAEYASGYGRNNRPVRVSPAVLAYESYGVKTTASDLVRYLEAMLAAKTGDMELNRAIRVSQTGRYVTASGMAQALGWELYSAPPRLETLLAGNSNEVIFNPQELSELPPGEPGRNVWINKTGSTNGFGAYVVLLPDKETGLVLLANRNYPNPARIQAAFRILEQLVK